MYQYILLIAVYLFYILRADSELSSLHEIWQAKPDSIKIDKKCHYFPIHARSDFYNGKWDELYRNDRTAALMADRHPLYSYSPCLTKYNLGNVLGNYFHEIFCAINTSTNLYIAQLVADNPHIPTEFQSGNRLYRHRMHSTYQSEEFSHVAFFLMLPYEIDVDYNKTFYRLTTIESDASNYTIEYLIPKAGMKLSYDNNLINQIDKHDDQLLHHHNIIPSSRLKNDKIDARIIESRKQLEKRCQCERYCWTDSTAPWVYHHQAIRIIMKRAIEYNYMVSVNVSQGSVLKPEYDLYDNITMISSSYLPIIPDVAIHYRCGDQVPSDTYGFLTFMTIISIISSHDPMPGYIYILSDHPKRAGILMNAPPFNNHCKPVLEAFHRKLSSYFPNTTIIVFRGADAVLDQTRLAQAKLTICSISTFCLWPAIANINRVYFPASPLAGAVRGSDTIIHKADKIIKSISSSKADMKIIVSNSSNDKQLPYFGPYFHWIKRPSAIIDFKADVTLQQVLQVLDAN